MVKFHRAPFRRNWLRLYIGFPFGVFTVVLVSFMLGWGFGLVEMANGFCTQYHYSDCGWLDTSIFDK